MVSGRVFDGTLGTETLGTSRVFDGALGTLGALPVSAAVVTADAARLVSRARDAPPLESAMLVDDSFFLLVIDERSSLFWIRLLMNCLSHLDHLFPLNWPLGTLPIHSLVASVNRCFSLMNLESLTNSSCPG